MIHKGNRIELRDEGVVQGIVRALNCVGSGITATVSGDVGTLTLGAAGGAALQFIVSYTPSAVASLDISSTYITSTYLQYLIGYQLTVTTDDGEINVRSDSSNGASVDAGASDYSFASDGRNTAGAAADAGTAVSMISLQDRAANAGIGNASPEAVQGYIWVRHLGDANNYPAFEYFDVHLDNSTRSIKNYGVGHRRATGAINFIRLLPTAGTMSGAVQLYGLRGV